MNFTREYKNYIFTLGYMLCIGLDAVPASVPPAASSLASHYEPEEEDNEVDDNTLDRWDDEDWGSLEVRHHFF